MPDFLKGTASTITVQILFNGAPVPDAEVRLTVINPAGETIVGGAVAGYLSNGWYQYTFAGLLLNRVGTYRAVWEATYHGDSLRTESVFTVGTTPYPGMTVKDIRHMVASTELGGMLTGKVTGFTAPDQIVIRGLAHLPDGDLNGSCLYVHAGPGVGQEATILSHQQSAEGAVLTVNPLDADLSVGNSLVEIQREHTVSQYISAVRLAQLSAAERLTVPMVDSSIVVAEGQDTFDIPSGFVRINAVYQGGEEIDPEDWEIIPGTGQIKVTGAVAGERLELRGSAMVGDINSDFSYVEVAPQYLVWKVCAMLLRTKAGGPATDADASMQRAAVYEQMALALLARLPQRIPPNSRRV